MDNILNFLGGLSWWVWVLIFLVLVAIRDIFIQRKHTISHNYPIVGHLRYFLESIGPEMRQYFVANNREELPFNRIERGWIYASAKKENNYEGFGTDRDIYAHHHIFINNAMMPYKMTKNHPNAN
ncbi:MAG: FMN-binding glutamate synthase family protein, partial [Bacteroidia bacterium]|nr:FMN-binding glutamate synthase family protein [Bacteroidia bacterium]